MIMNKNLQSDLIYCSECYNYYLKSSFQKTIYKHYADKGILAFSSELTKAIEKEFPYYMCPKGHKILKGEII